MVAFYRVKTTFRPTPEQQTGLAKIACSLGPTIKKSDVMSIAVDALISYWTKHNGRLLLPIDFDESFIVVPPKKTNWLAPELSSKQAPERAETKHRRNN